jgi:hypothetical protein
MVVLATGSKEADLLPEELPETSLSRKFLPSKGDASWRLMIGKLIYGFFRQGDGTRGPLFSQVVLKVESGLGLPSDVLECLATCYLALCATRVAIDEKGLPFKLSNHEQKLAQALYRYAYLLPNEAMSEFVKEIFHGMGERYADRLGISLAALIQEHEGLVAAAQNTAR